MKSIKSKPSDRGENSTNEIDKLFVVVFVNRRNDVIVLLSGSNNTLEASLRVIDFSLHTTSTLVI